MIDTKLPTDHTEFDLTAVAHADCADCLTLVSTAVAMAFGSTGATVRNDLTRLGGLVHAVNVTRTRCRRAGTDCLCPVCSPR